MRPLYLLDTCVISEPVKPEPSERVMKKLRDHEGLTAISSVVWHELLFGVNRMPPGKRKDRLYAYIMEIVAPFFPVIPYDEHSAWIHSAIRVRLEKEGISLSFADGQIAATAMAHNMILVTRNEDDFRPVSDLNLENWFSVGLIDTPASPP
jgi:tRNA(fMet)-specific endonuclease VapC